MISHDTSKQSGHSDPMIKTAKPRTLSIKYQEPEIEKGRMNSNMEGKKCTEEKWIGSNNTLWNPGLKTGVKSNAGKEVKAETINTNYSKFMYGYQEQCPAGQAYDKTSLTMGQVNSYNQTVKNTMKNGKSISNGYSGYIGSKQHVAMYSSNGAGRVNAPLDSVESK